MFTADGQRRYIVEMLKKSGFSPNKLQASQGGNDFTVVLAFLDKGSSMQMYRLAVHSGNTCC